MAQEVRRRSDPWNRKNTFLVGSSNYEVEGWECSASCRHSIVPSARSGLLGSQPPWEWAVADEQEIEFLMQPIKR